MLPILLPLIIILLNLSPLPRFVYLLGATCLPKIPEIEERDVKTYQLGKIQQVMVKNTM